MSAAVVLVLVVTSGANDPVTTATVKAAEQALGVEATVEVEQVLVADETNLLSIAEHRRAAVALVRWDANNASANVHFHGQGATKWVDRTVVFQSDDADDERGRALGFTLASMMPENRRAEPPPLTVVREPTTHETPNLPPPRPRHWFGSVDVTGSGAFSPEAFGTGLGAQLGASLYWRRLGVRLGSSLRVGDVPPAQATALYVGIGLGFGVRMIEPRPQQRFGLTVRTDFLVQYQSLTHLSADDVTPAHLDRWLPGADAVLVGTFDLTSAAALVLDGGLEAAFGTTEIYVAGSPVAQIFPLRILLDVGVLARF